MEAKEEKWDEHLEETLGYDYDSLNSICEYFGVTKIEAIGILIVSEIKKLNEHQSNLDYNGRELLKCR